MMSEAVCQEALCQRRCDSRNDLRHHLSRDHNLLMEVDTIRFSNMQDFAAWKLMLELQDTVSFGYHGDSSSNLCTGSTAYTFNCTATALCTAAMIVCHSRDVEVEYHRTHYAHGAHVLQQVASADAAEQDVQVEYHRTHYAHGAHMLQQVASADAAEQDVQVEYHGADGAHVFPQEASADAAEQIFEGELPVSTDGNQQDEMLDFLNECELVFEVPRMIPVFETFLIPDEENVDEPERVVPISERNAADSVQEHVEHPYYNAAEDDEDEEVEDEEVEDEEVEEEEEEDDDDEYDDDYEGFFARRYRSYRRKTTREYVSDRHFRAVVMCSPGCVRKVNNNRWHVQSSDRLAWYDVTRSADHAGHRPCGTCVKCAACEHVFECTCRDYQDRDIACKHIHLVCIYRPEDEDNKKKIKKVVVLPVQGVKTDDTDEIDLSLDCGDRIKVEVAFKQMKREGQAYSVAKTKTEVQESSDLPKKLMKLS